VTELQLTPSSGVQQPQTKASAGLILGRIVLGVLVGVGLLLAAAVIALPIAGKLFEIRAFHTPSNSMCPAICIDERFFASMNAYRGTPPKRGDVILHRTAESAVLFTKRVVGIAGDTVSPGLHNEVLVNGKRLGQVGMCGKPSVDAQQSDGPPFNSVKVPDGELFVLGDNFSNSYDSRFFGPITVDQVRGRPVLIYWSPESSRVGCRIR
jgi:signal peptidase I